jgi:UDP-glucose 4-epimerase
MKKIIVTGGAGYIGSHAVKALLTDREHEIHVVDNFSQSRHNVITHPNITYHELDICDGTLLKELFVHVKPEIVFHFAALASVPDSVKNPSVYYKNNVVGSLNLLEAMRESACNKIVFSSSASTYGEPITEVISEDHPKKPTNPYGQTKLDMEHMLQAYFTAYGISSVSFRYFCAAGAEPTLELGEYHTPETHVIPCIVETLLGKREVFTIFGDDYPTPDGSGIRDYIHVVDLANAHIAAMNKLATEKICTQYNLGINKGFSVKELIVAAENVSGRKLNYQVKERRPGDPSRLIADPSKAMRELQWEPQYTDIADIITTAYESFKKRL